ncbi:MAG: dihydroorotate dehydrogenase electron transfer subunit [Pseudomonadota bacterium]
MPLQESAVILSNEQLTSSCYRIRLESSKIAKYSTPGQFVMVHVNAGPPPLLRRPFSIHTVTGGKDTLSSGLEILYKVVGKTTGIMSELKPGDSLDIIGPLGHGFTYSSENQQRIFLVAGGIGIAPLYYLITRILTADRGDQTIALTLFWGGRTADDFFNITPLENVEATGRSPLLKTRLSTENGSVGYHGLVTNLFKEKLSSGDKPDIIYACGPNPMLKETFRLADFYSIPCQFSFETMMACGFGACLGCAIKKAGNKLAYWHACTDGPILNPKSIDWNVLCADK